VEEEYREGVGGEGGTEAGGNFTLTSKRTRCVQRPKQVKQPTEEEKGNPGCEAGVFQKLR